jgi:acyl carrier protein
MCESSILLRVRDFVEQNAARRTRHSVLEDRHFFDAVLAEPKALNDLLTFIESEFGVEVSSLEITRENFGTLEAVASFVCGKQPYAVG